MTETEINTFIEEMASIGDKWTKEQVEECYGTASLAEALKARKAEMGQFLSSLGTAILYATSQEKE